MPLLLIILVIEGSIRQFTHPLHPFLFPMIKRPYQSMSFNGSSGHRPTSGGSGFGGGKPWERGGDRRSGGGSDRRSGGFGGRPGGFGGGRPSGDREMHDATCNSCGNACQVPFRPNGSKPIYCSNCFKKDDSFSARSNDRPAFGGDRGGDRFGGDRGRDSFGGRDSRDNGFPEKRLFKAECAKCHSECEVPFRPNGEKPVYCRACFGQTEIGAKSAAASDVSMHKLNEQFKLLNAKLDLIIEAIGIGDEDDEEGDEEVFEEEDEMEEGEDEEVEEADEAKTDEVLTLDAPTPEAAPKKSSKKAKA